MEMEQPEIIRVFKDGLVLRRACPEDADRIAQFNGKMHGEDPYDSVAVEAWTRDLLTSPHPTFHARDFTLVENPVTGEVVSTLCTISQTWLYENVPFKIGRPELVGTLAEYRKRGLVREQFEIVHEWSRQRQELAQFITGIPFYYRQFGYEMALELGGGQGGYEPQVPFLSDGQEETFLFRKAVEADIPWLVQIYQEECSRSAVSAWRDESIWRNELFGKNSENVNRLDVHIIETRDGQPSGYIACPPYTWDGTQSVYRYQLSAGRSYLEVTPAVLRFLWKIGQENAARREKKLKGFHLSFGTDHPAYKVIPDRLVSKRPSYAFYMRVPDLPAFINHIRTVLEARIKESVCAGYSGELKISFYRTGLRLVFENGLLTSAEDWQPVIQKDEGSAAFPNLTFLQLVFGLHSLDELRSTFPDCWAEPDPSVVLAAMFPKKSSSVWTIS